MIPFIPLQFLNFKISLNMEQAVAILGRSLPLKRGIKGFDEVVSFKYQPLSSYKSSPISVSGVMVYVRYESSLDGIRVKVTIMPTVVVLLFFIFAFGFNLSFPHDRQDALLSILPFLVFYLIIWWETVETKNAIRSMFQEFII